MPEQNHSDSPASQSPLAPHPLTRVLATDLCETDQHAVAYINRIVWVLGPAVAELLADEAYVLHAGAGMLTRDGSRQRTLGGIFFRLAYGRASRAQKRLLRPDLQRPSKRPQRKRQAAGESPPTRSFQEIAQAADSWEAGALSKAEIRLVGRPVKVQPATQGQCVAFTLPPMALPPLPSWVTRPPDTRYLVLVTINQWQAVEPALQDQTVRLLIEGFGVVLPQFAGGIAVLATKCVSLAPTQAKPLEPVVAHLSTAIE